MRNAGIEYTAPGEMGFYDLGPVPEPGPTGILIHTQYSGITNGTERHTLLGEHVWAGRFPGRHGYQCVGTVAKAGADVRGFAEGDWVFFGLYVGHRAWHVVNVGPGVSHLCIRLPEDVDPKVCALCGVAGVAMRGVRRFGIAAGDNVWVAGQGLIGQFAAQAARGAGARVTVSDVNEDRLQRALQCGAHRTVDARAGDAWDALRKTAPYTYIIDACGVERFLPDVQEHLLLAHGGTIGLLAVRMETSFLWPFFHATEGAMEVSCHFDLDDLRVVLQFVQQGVIRVEPLITHSVSIDEAPGIYATLRDRPADLLGVVFDWTE